jgi:hypothetical protein
MILRDTIADASGQREPKVARSTERAHAARDAPGDVSGHLFFCGCLGWA